jgi:hypothetical protein
MSWIERLSQWLSPRSRAAEIGVPSAERTQLRDEQRSLADDIESLFRVFDERLQNLSRRAHDLSDAEFAREATRIKTAQDELRRALRRLESSVKTTPQLERELAQWERLPTNGSLHADHPIVRSEMIRSELAIRQGVVRSDIAEADDRSVKDVVDLIKQQLGAEEPVDDAEVMLADPPVAEYRFASREPLPMEDEQQLLIAIKEATCEAERWHAVGVTASDDDAIVQVHHVRDLHAMLKRVDRERGIERDRVALAIKIRA